VWPGPRGPGPDAGGRVPGLEESGFSEKGTTPARRAMSASPSCQCIASAARQGTASSSATLAHISGLNLEGLLVGVEAGVMGYWSFGVAKYCRRIC
jgi:hypothetical protein